MKSYLYELNLPNPEKYPTPSLLSLSIPPSLPSLSFKKSLKITLNSKKSRTFEPSKYI